MANFIDEAMTNSQTTLKLRATSEFPQKGVIQVESEKMHYTRSTDKSILSLTRAYASTSAATHAAGKAVTLVSTDVTVRTFDGQQLSNLADPSNAQDAATKAYVDAADALAELVANKDTTGTLGTSDTKYPSQKAVKTYVDAKISVLASDPGSPTEGQVWYNTTTHLLKYYNGTDVKVVATV